MPRRRFCPLPLAALRLPGKFQTAMPAVVFIADFSLQSPELPYARQVAFVSVSSALHLFGCLAFSCAQRYAQTTEGLLPIWGAGSVC